MATFIYGVFFLSGAAALMYEVIWVRALGLVFGGTHLAVTTVLSVFMGGLALGSFLVGKRVDTVEKPLRFYGYLETSIAFFAVVFIILMKIYPSIYTFLVRGNESSILYLSIVRIVFSIVSMIVPTALMGATLPVLTKFVSRNPERVGVHLSFLYGFNTLGAVAGAAAAGFLLLRYFSVTTTLHIAIAINVVIGLFCILFPTRLSSLPRPLKAGPEYSVGDRTINNGTDSLEKGKEPLVPLRLVLLGIGVSGFCALGYEVLWTRILTLAIGTSVYGFTIMLVAFLIGLAIGSATFGLLQRLFPWTGNRTEKLIFNFGLIQCVIGITAFFVTFFIRDLPVNSISLYKFFLGSGLQVFAARQSANLTLAFSYMFIPAFFMGVAFPLAGKVTIGYGKKVGHAVGNVLTFNTIGAILGSAISGYLLIYILGIEQSLQFLTFINIGFGLLVVFSLLDSKLLNLGVVGLTLATLILLLLNPMLFRMWDMKYFAILQNNDPEVYATPEKKRDVLENTDVLFYHEGVNSTISTVKVKGGLQSVIVNGKVVASTALEDRQCQLTLGHLPMLMHKDPQKVLVVGLGTGMTLGAVSVHPHLDELTLVEIEPKVSGAAETFERYNHHVLDNPKLNIYFNDGRNFLMTTKNKYDVITADPIHPWTQGSGYLFTTEYYEIASEHLLPGGLMCQWLPVYEMSVENLKSVVNTFSRSFTYTMMWLTLYDAELIGSNRPIIIDKALLEERIAFSPVAADLESVMMGSATDFLSYFLMGTNGMRTFARDGIINTDDNLYLEFSTPIVLGKRVMSNNILALTRYRESILPYLVLDRDINARTRQTQKWTELGKAAKIFDRAQALFVGGYHGRPEFRHLMEILENRYPQFAPGRFLKKEYEDTISKIPRLVQKAAFFLLLDAGKPIRMEISGVIAPVSDSRAAAVFVDNDRRIIFGKHYFSGPRVDQSVSEFISEAMTAIRGAYRRETEIALSHGEKLPSVDTFKEKIKEVLDRVSARHSKMEKSGYGKAD